MLDMLAVMYYRYSLDAQSCIIWSATTRTVPLYPKGPCSRCAVDDFIPGSVSATLNPGVHIYMMILKVLTCFIHCGLYGSMVAETRGDVARPKPWKTVILERSPTQTSCVQEIGACGNTVYYLYNYSYLSSFSSFHSCRTWVICVYEVTFPPKTHLRLFLPSQCPQMKQRLGSLDCWEWQRDPGVHCTIQNDNFMIQVDKLK